MRNGPLNFFVGTGIVAEGRFVTIDHAAQSVDYTAAAGAADAVTLSNGDAALGESVTVQMLNDVSKSFYFEGGGAFAIGDQIEVGADGKGVVYSAGAVVCRTRNACAVDGQKVEGYNV